MDSFLRRVVDKYYPKGPPHKPAPDGDMSDFRDATANNLDTIRTPVKNLAYVRNPAKTNDVPSLEKEYGVNENANLTEAERRTQLKSEVYKKKSVASDNDLQSRLDNAGFDLTVYNNGPNGPAIDPAILLDQNFVMGAEFGDYYAGNTNAYAGRIGGELLVNGRIFDQRSAFFGAGDIYAYDGLDTIAVAGYFERLIQELKTYATPTDPASWPFVFFVGGSATFNPDGSIATIEQGLVPSEQQNFLESIILKTKPMFTWCGLIVTYI